VTHMRYHAPAILPAFDADACNCISHPHRGGP
jgi:hypothetical protein